MRLIVRMKIMVDMIITEDAGEITGETVRCRNRNKRKHFVNRGLVSGPMCIVYGIGTVLMTVGLQGITGFWLFLFATVYAAAIELAAGKLIERIYHERWWNYNTALWIFFICSFCSLL